MKLKYEELLQKHGLKVEDLPKHAKTGINSIKGWQKIVHLTEKSGKKLNPDILDKIEANDDWVCMEITNFVKGKQGDNSPLPNSGPTDAEKAKAEEAARLAAEEQKRKADEQNNSTSNNSQQNSTSEHPAGAKIDKELAALFKAGKTNLSMEELKATAPTAYELIFEAYEQGGENGIQTSHYSLIETEKEVFTLSKI